MCRSFVALTAMTENSCKIDSGFQHMRVAKGESCWPSAIHLELGLRVELLMSACTGLTILGAADDMGIGWGEAAVQLG